MKIRSVEFSGSMADPLAPFPGTLPQVAFSGRSNVGKSSLINVILQRTRRKLAHVSARPGKTQLLNFYRVNDRFFLVDLPGFGFAKAPVGVREAWGKMVDTYLARPDGPRGAVHLVDIRHSLTAGDRTMLEQLARLEIPTLVVLTKADKLKKSQAARRVAALTAELGLDADQVVPFSTLTGEGREELLAALEGLFEEWEAQDAAAAGVPAGAEADGAPEETAAQPPLEAAGEREPA